MKYFDRNFCELEDDPTLSESAINEYSAAVAYWQDQVARYFEQHPTAPRNHPIKADLGRAVGRLGEALRFAGRFSEALEYKQRALAIWEELDRSRAIVLARLRLAVILDQLGRGSEALAILHALRERIPNSVPNRDAANPDNANSNANPNDYEVYADFIHEALALAYVRQGNFKAALPELDAALCIRLERGRENMITRSRELSRRVEALAK